MCTCPLSKTWGTFNLYKNWLIPSFCKRAASLVPIFSPAAIICLSALISIWVFTILVGICKFWKNLINFYNIILFLNFQFIYYFIIFKIVTKIYITILLIIILHSLIFPFLFLIKIIINLLLCFFIKSYKNISLIKNSFLLANTIPINKIVLIASYL